MTDLNRSNTTFFADGESTTENASKHITGFSEKIFLKPDMPTEDFPVSDQQRIQFASIPDFLIRMQAAKFIPHTDINRYPSIKKRKEQNG